MKTIKTILNALNIFDGLGDSRKKIRDNVKGWKTSCVYYSYTWFTFIFMLLILSAIVVIIVAGVNKEFQLYVDIFRDIILGIMKYVFYFFSIAVLATFGVTYINGKLEVMKPPKEEKEDNEVKEDGTSQDTL